ncbi:hypothetical protein HYE31_02960 [Mycoplasmopsis bovis]|nr:hypothetical protein HYE31_02960 [Mycoplasmopsis bovis]
MELIKQYYDRRTELNNKIDNVISEIIKILDEKVITADQLRKSILQWAIAANWLNKIHDESAADLLNEIRYKSKN